MIPVTFIIDFRELPLWSKAYIRPNTFVRLSLIMVFPQDTSTEKNGGAVGYSWDTITEALSCAEKER